VLSGKSFTCFDSLIGVTPNTSPKNRNGYIHQTNIVTNAFNPATPYE